jgi:hypothetical protein
MNTARWFLAHGKSDGDANIDRWASRLTELLEQPGWRPEVTAARDDYNLRARAMGGWHRWCRDVPCGERWDGHPLFHGILIPSTQLIVGKATDELVRGFIEQGKHAFFWDCELETFTQIIGTQDLGLDDWRRWSQIKLA